MASNRVASKETIESSIGEAVEKTSVDLLVYVDTQFFVERGSSLTWN